MSTLKFLLAVWKTNLLAAMEYRASFLTQMLGMMLNNALYFVVWVIFFDRFQKVQGWGLGNMYVTFGISASAFGLVSLFLGNAFNLGDIITRGRLDYYLSLPRPVLLHTLVSRSTPHGAGDVAYGLLSFLVSGYFSPSGLLRFLLGMLLAALVFSSFLIIIQSLAFWMGNASNLVTLANNAMITFAIYPIDIFDSGAKLLLFTLIPAALMGAVPASFAIAFTWQSLALLTLGALALLSAALGIFHLGLRRYESGSAIQIEI